MTDKTVPLPEPAFSRIPWNGEGKLVNYFTADQMQDYARAVLASAGGQAKDAERMDWLCTKGEYDTSEIDDDGHTKFEVYFWTGSKTLREAIDAAIASGKSGEVKS